MHIDAHEAKEFYHLHGWFIADVFTEGEMDELQYGIDRFYAGEQDRRLDILLSRDWTPDKGAIMRQNDYISLRMDAIRDLLCRSKIGEIASILTDSDSIRLFHDQLMYKPPTVKSTAVGWHTDKAYWQTCTSSNLITAWIPLQDCTENVGPLVVIDQSHLWENSGRVKSFHDQDMRRLQEGSQSNFEKAEKVSFTLKRGQVSFHHCMAMHGSYPNRSDRPRTSLSVHMQDSSNRYRRASDEEACVAPHQNDMLCRRDEDGFPDYSDPDVFPVFWPQ
jgi:ectoine hydroxylase-related dioxygenase (phytanoyl-CoA dioxygenase family)